MKKYIVGFVFILALVFSVTKLVSACGFWTDCPDTSAKAVERETVGDTYARLSSAVPAPRLENSLERTNISNRLTLFSDPAKISYIYLTSYGKVMAFYTVKGKITSGQKRLTSPIGSTGCGYQEPCVQTDLAELDGTYGPSSPYIFFWTTEGAYVQWNGEYMLSDQALKLTTTPELVRNIK